MLGGVFDLAGETMDEAPLSLADREWQAPLWGNLEANIRFLDDCGFLDSRSTMLEIGCGKGGMLKALHSRGHQVCGIDADEYPISECRRMYPELDAKVGSGDAIPHPDASFDIVLSFDVFEHIKDSDRHLSEVFRVLRPGGHYLLQTPNKWTNIPFELLRHWRKFRMGPIAGYRELTKEHCALHNYWQLRRRLRRHGFESTFVKMPVVNDYFRAKMRTYFGPSGPVLLALFNPDRFPQPLRTNFYVSAVRSPAA